MAVLFSISAIANVNQKLSGSTQLFIAERDGRISLDMEIDGPTLPTRAPLLRAHQVERVIAPAQLVNGVEMVSAFIQVDPNATAKIENMGVIIQERFKKFVVAMIPVDKIESVAQIAAVRQVNVARKSGKEIKLTCDTVILAVGYTASPLEIPKETQYNIHIIGDAKASGNLLNAVWSAYDVALRI